MIDIIVSIIIIGTGSTNPSGKMRGRKRSWMVCILRIRVMVLFEPEVADDIG